MVEQISITNEQIISSENRLIEALAVGNISPGDVLLKDSIILTPLYKHNKKSFNGVERESNHRKISHVSTTERTVITLDEFTFVTVTFHIKENYSKQSIDKKFKYLSVWKFYENTWEILAGSGFHI